MDLYYLENGWAFTEDERKIGLLSILHTNQFEDEEEYYEKNNSYDTPTTNIKQKNEKSFIQKKVYSKIQKKIIELTAGLATTSEIRNSIIKFLYFEQIDKQIQTYALKENLSKSFVNMAKEKQGLKILLKSFFKSKCNFVLDNILINNINFIVQQIYINTNNDIVYYRVSKIQQFIHKTIIEKNGFDTLLKMNKLDMANILSACRLHLEIMDFKYKNIKSILYQYNKTKKYKQKEYYISQQKYLLPNQKYVPRWKINNEHFQPIFKNLLNTKELIIKINDLDLTLDTQLYIKKILTITEAIY